jgi:thiamine biosynthesis lipoprotein
MRANRIIMGTGVSIDVPRLQDAALIESVFKRLNQIDRRFSTYKENSEVSRFRRGELREAELSSELVSVMRACLKLEKVTNGYFSAWFNGQFDPTGYVKAWSIHEACKLIRKSGYETYCIGVGGDICARSNSKTWRIGIENPVHPKAVLGVIKAKNIAVATSGNYKRGKHVYNPMTKRPVDHFISVTVSGPNIIKSDVFATSAFVMAKRGVAFIQNQPGYEAAFITKDGSVQLTAGMERLLGQQSLVL